MERAPGSIAITVTDSRILTWLGLTFDREQHYFTKFSTGGLATTQEEQRCHFRIGDHHHRGVRCRLRLFPGAGFITICQQDDA